MRVVTTVGDLADLLEDIERMKFTSRCIHENARDAWFGENEAQRRLAEFKQKLHEWRAEPLRIAIDG